MTVCRTSADKDNDDTIEECLVRLGRGDREAAEPLYTLAAPSVYGYALSILKNRHDAEDVLHDCFIAVMSAGRASRLHGCSPLQEISRLTG